MNKFILVVVNLSNIMHERTCTRENIDEEIPTRENVPTEAQHPVKDTSPGPCMASLTVRKRLIGHCGSAKKRVLLIRRIVLGWDPAKQQDLAFHQGERRCAGMGTKS